LVAGRAIKDMRLKRTGPGAGVFDAIEVNDPVAVEVTHGEGEVGGIRLGDGCAGLQEEGLVIRGAAENVHLQLAGAGIAALEAIEVCDPVAVEVTHGEGELAASAWVIGVPVCRRNARSVEAVCRKMPTEPPTTPYCRSTDSCPTGAPWFER
jgi:hypothetical protein